MDNRNLSRFVNSFLLILLATNRAANCLSDEPEPQKIIASDLFSNANSTLSPKTVLATVTPNAASEKSPNIPSALVRLPALSANLTSNSSVTLDQPLNQANTSKLSEHPINRFASDRQSISENNKLYDHSNHLGNSSFSQLHTPAAPDYKSSGGPANREQTDQINSTISSSDSSSFNSSLSIMKRNDAKCNDMKPSRTPSSGNQSQISQVAGVNGTIGQTEQMSFNSSNDKLINSRNGHSAKENGKNGENGIYDHYRKQVEIERQLNMNTPPSLDYDSAFSLTNLIRSGLMSSKKKRSNVSLASLELTTLENRTQAVANVTRSNATKSIVSSVTVRPNGLNESGMLSQPSAHKTQEKVQTLALPANQSLASNRTEAPQLASNSTAAGWEPNHSEKVLVYPVIQANQSNDRSLSAQSKRAPHYLEEKFRQRQPEKLTTTTSTTPPPERLDRPTPILDTRPLVEDVGSELNLRALDERLISEEELLHHSGSSVEDSSYEYGGHHGSHHSNLHHANKHNQSKQTLDPSWFEQNCLENCTCESNRKWPEIHELSGGQSRKTLNCSNNELDDYPVLANELSKHVERLSLADNSIKTLQVNTELFYCEKLIELDLSNNQLRQLSAGPFNYKHIQHPVVEFHPSHNHHSHREDDQAPKTTTGSPIAALNSTSTNSTAQLAAQNTTTPLPPRNSTTTITNFNRQNLFSHCHRLRLLVLSGNDLNTLSTGSFRGLKRLRELYLDNAQIRFIEKNAFLGANELRLLSLRFNLLNAVHADMFQHMINLKVLELTGNQLTYLGAGVFNSLVALQALHLGHNKLRQLSFQCFSGLDGLQLLTMNSNQLESVPRFALQPLKKLKILDMSSNPISKILEDDFSHSFVQLLLLNHLNQLQHVARFSFWDLPYLNELQITHCEEFVHLDEQAIVGAPSLHRLKLDHNAFFQLDDRLLENLARMTIAARRQLKVYLSGNPFNCDCFLKPVYLVSALLKFTKRAFSR